MVEKTTAFRQPPTMAFQVTYPGDRSQQAVAWIEQVTDIAFDGDELEMALHNGVALATLANAISGGAAIRKISHSRMPFPQRENIAAFLEACRSFGVPEYELFATSDLYEQENLKQVVNCLFALAGAILPTCRSYFLPIVGLLLLKFPFCSILVFRLLAVCSLCLSTETVYHVPGYEGPSLAKPPASYTGSHHSARNMDALWGKSSAAEFGNIDAAARAEHQSTAGPSIAASTAAGRKIQVQRSSQLEAFHQLDASENARKAAARRAGFAGGAGTGEVDPSFHAKMPTKKKKGPPAIPKVQCNCHYFSTPHSFFPPLLEISTGFHRGRSSTTRRSLTSGAILLAFPSLFLTSTSLFTSLFLRFS